MPEQNLLNEKSRIIGVICDALLADDRTQASRIARSQYPFVPLQNAGRKYSPRKATALFVRDGFIDRYTGSCLIFPGTLRLLARLLPEEFPSQPNGKMSVSHIVYWELYPSLDHVVPVARGGADDEKNLVTTSMLKNGAKANWMLEELGWHLLPPGDFTQWDGLLRWFVKFIEHDPSHLEDGYTRVWHQAAVRALEAL